MIPIVIAYDEQDESLGTFFEACKNDIDSFFSARGLFYSDLDSNNLNVSSVNRKVEKLDKFVFGAYSHGDSTSLLKSGRSQYISKNQNGIHFNNSFFYTFSCSTGKELGLDLVKLGCQCFIGYNKTIYIWTTSISEFIECANEGLFSFLDGFDTNEIIIKMIEKYNEKINSLYRTNFMAASTLRMNRDALIMHGKNISINNL